MARHGLAELDSALEIVRIVADRHPHDLRAAVDVALRQRRVASRNQLNRVAGVHQPARKVGDVRAGPLGAGHDVESGVKHTRAAYPLRFIVV